MAIENSILLSVIIVNYNGKEFLDECIRSIYKNSGVKNLEIIIVDNNSTDGSPDYISKNHKSVQLIPLKTNKGYGSANNVGAQLAQGKYIIILNNDVIVHTNAFLNISEYAASHAPNTIISGRVLNKDGSPQKCAEKYPSLISEFFIYGIYQIKYINIPLLPIRWIPVWDKMEPQYVDWVTGCYFLIAREYFNKISGFDEKFFMFYEDTDICKRTTLDGGKVIYYPFSEITHLKGASTGKLKSFNALLLSFDSCVIYIDKYYNRFILKSFLLALQITWLNMLFLLKLLNIFNFGNNDKLHNKIELLDKIFAHSRKTISNLN